MVDVISVAEETSKETLQNAISWSASEGRTSTVETLLSIYNGRFGSSLEVAEEALRTAQKAARWDTVAYLASYLNDAKPTKYGGTAPRHQFERELLTRLAVKEEEENSEACESIMNDVVDTSEPEEDEIGSIVEDMVVPAAAWAEEKNENDPSSEEDNVEDDPAKIKFSIVDPEAKEGEWRSASDPSPYFGLTKEKMEQSLSWMQDPDEVVIESGAIRVLFDYPLSESHVIRLIPPDGAGHFTRAGLAKAIALKYQEIYREERETTTLKEESIAERNRREGCKKCLNIMNRATTDGKWGIWGHDLGDLDLHAVRRAAGEDYYWLGIDS